MKIVFDAKQEISMNFENVYTVKIDADQLQDMISLEGPEKAGVELLAQIYECRKQQS